MHASRLAMSTRVHARLTFNERGQPVRVPAHQPISQARRRRLFTGESRKTKSPRAHRRYLGHSNSEEVAQLGLGKPTLSANVSPRSCRLGFDQSLPLCLTLERVKPNLRTRLSCSSTSLGGNCSVTLTLKRWRNWVSVNRLFSANASLYNPQRMVAGAPFSVVR